MKIMYAMNKEDKHYDNTNGSIYKFCEEDAIVIKRIKVLDSSGNCIKFAKLKEVTPHLCKFPVIFDERIQDTEKTD